MSDVNESAIKELGEAMDFGKPAPEWMLKPKGEAWHGDTCKKSLYPNRKTAITVINMREEKMRGNGAKLRAYFCGKCKGWHITSKEHKWHSRRESNAQ